MCISDRYDASLPPEGDASATTECVFSTTADDVCSATTEDRSSATTEAGSPPKAGGELPRGDGIARAVAEQCECKKEWLALKWLRVYVYVFFGASAMHEQGIRKWDFDRLGSN